MLLDHSQAPTASHCPVCPSTAVLSASLVAVTTLLVLWRLRAQGRLAPLGLLVAVKESLLLSERKTSLL